MHVHACMYYTFLNACMHIQCIVVMQYSYCMHGLVTLLMTVVLACMHGTFINFSLQ